MLNRHAATMKLHRALPIILLLLLSNASFVGCANLNEPTTDVVAGSLDAGDGDGRVGWGDAPDLDTLLGDSAPVAAPDARALPADASQSTSDGDVTSGDTSLGIDALWPPAQTTTTLAATFTPAPLFNPTFVLALSWQPAFCRSHPYKPECMTQTSARYDATHLSLHGLWPAGCSYFQVPQQQKKLDWNKQWDQLPTLPLPSLMRARLYVVMPGAMSFLHRHEWVKHGTCYSPGPAQYMGEMIGLIDTVNASAVGALFKSHVGKALTTLQIRAAFDQAFGKGAGDRVLVECKGGLITEIKLNLRVLDKKIAPIGTMLLQADTLPTGCDGGLLDVAKPATTP